MKAYAVDLVAADHSSHEDQSYVDHGPAASGTCHRHVVGTCPPHVATVAAGTFHYLVGDVASCTYHRCEVIVVGTRHCCTETGHCTCHSRGDLNLGSAFPRNDEGTFDADNFAIEDRPTVAGRSTHRYHHNRHLEVVTIHFEAMLGSIDE